MHLCSMSEGQVIHARIKSINIFTFSMDVTCKSSQLTPLRAAVLIEQYGYDPTYYHALAHDKVGLDFIGRFLPL
jgi:hypothetical protein